MTTKGLRTWKIPRFEANDGVVLLINGTAKVDVIENCFSKNGRTQVIEFQSAVGKPVKAKIVPCCAVWCSLGRVILWTPMIWNIFLGWGSLKQFSRNPEKIVVLTDGFLFGASNLRHPFFRWWFLLDGFETPLKNARQGGIPMDGRLCGNNNATTGVGNSQIFWNFHPESLGKWST